MPQNLHDMSINEQLYNQLHRHHLISQRVTKNLLVYLDTIRNYPKSKQSEQWINQQITQLINNNITYVNQWIDIWHPADDIKNGITMQLRNKSSLMNLWIDTNYLNPGVNRAKQDIIDHDIKELKNHQYHFKNDWIRNYFIHTHEVEKDVMTIAKVTNSTMKEKS